MSIDKRSGVVLFVYETELSPKPLECFLDHEPAELGDREMPGYPATYSLQQVVLSGIDITGLISEELVRSIEEAAYEYFESGQADIDDYEPPDDIYAPV